MMIIIWNLVKIVPFPSFIFPAGRSGSPFLTIEILVDSENRKWTEWEESVKRRFACLQ